MNSVVNRIPQFYSFRLYVVLLTIENETNEKESAKI